MTVLSMEFVWDRRASAIVDGKELIVRHIIVKMSVIVELLELALDQITVNVA